MGICQTAPNRERPDTDLTLLNYQEEMKFLYVITIVFNPARSRSTIKLYNSFKAQMEKLKIKLITVECAYQNSPYTVTVPNYEPYNIQLKTKSAFFQKENLINLAFLKIPNDCKYVMVIDYEVEFKNPQWVYDSIKSLNMLKIVQLFEDVIVLDSLGNELRRDRGFAAHFFGNKSSSNLTTDLLSERKQIDNPTIASGYAWGFRAESLHELGGLLDFSLLGNADRIIGACLLKRSEEYLPYGLNSRFKSYVKDWEDKASSLFQQGIGYLPGTIRVGWTGIKRGKKYQDRWDILEKHSFDPKYDIIKDEKGLFMISDNKPKLEEDLRQFFLSLNGDMNDKI